MGFIPSDARWYLADVILEHRIEGDSRNVVHVNTHLIEAESAEVAFVKAIELGKAAEIEFQNTDGKLVRVSFRGLRDLNVIHEKLEHGAELCYREDLDVPEGTIKEWITPKSQLGVFAPIETSTEVPNYMPDSVRKMLEAELSRRQNEVEE